MPIRTVRRRRVALPEPSRRPRTVWPKLPPLGRARWAALPLGCVLLGGTTERWSQAALLLVLGTALLVAPPRPGLGRGLGLVLGALGLLSLVAFLPAGWFHAPAWRTALTEDFGIKLPATLTPQPILTAEACVTFAAGVAWFYIMLTMRWTEDERRRAGGLYAGGAVAVAVLCLGLYQVNVLPAIWHGERRFGPFPNRNQTADFFAISALPVLACARAAWRAGGKVGALGWLAGWLALALAVAQCYSRAGLLLLFGTTVFYLVVETLHRTRHQPAGQIVRWRRLAMVASLGLVLGTGLLLFGGETLTRLRAGGGASANNNLSDSLRLGIYQDTVRMVNASPWCGNGLDTFRPLFPTFRRLANQNTLDVWHPESDWLWLASELGWGGVAVAAVGVGLVARRLRLPRHGDARPLRLAAALGVAGFLVHSFVDVSAHRVGSMFAALFLLSLALPGGSAAKDGEVAGTVEQTTPRWLGWTWRGVGVVFLLVGGLWLLAALRWLTPPGAQGVARLKTDAVALANQRSYAASSAMLTRALDWSPLDWQAYYLRGANGVYTRGLVEASLADFRRARYLASFNPNVPVREAQLWAAAGQTTPAVGALLEACRREPGKAETFIRSVAAHLVDGPAFSAQFGAAARRDPTLTEAFVQVLGEDEDPAFIAHVLQVDPELRRLDRTQKATFFHMWATRGDPKTLVAGMVAHPGWQASGWRWWADAQARVGTPGAVQSACGIVERFIPPAELPASPKDERSLEDLRRQSEGNGYEPQSAYPLFRAQEEAGNRSAALQTVLKVTAQPDCPAYFYYLAAKTAGDLGQWETSWTAWQQYMDAPKANK